MGHLALLRDFVDLASSPSLPEPHRPTLLVPHVVVAELDGLKASSRLAEPTRRGTGVRAQSSIAALARAATNWLLDALAPGRASAIVRGQRKGETLFGSRGPPPGESNDSLVLDAALYHVQRAGRAVLLTDDRNLRLRATIEQVEALGVDDDLDARRLLERLSPAAVNPGSPPRGQAPEPRPPLSPEQSRHSSSPKTPRRRRSSPPRRAPLPPAPPLVPTPPAPPRPARPPRASSMELDPPTPPPLHASLEPPPLWPVQRPPDIFRNASALLAHFVALPLFRHAFEHLRRTKPAEQGRWQDEMGDWREWTATECVEAVRRWWDEGDVAGLCRIGLEAAAAAGPPRDATALARRAPQKAAPTSPRAAGASDSRWASAAPFTTRAPLAPTPASPPSTSRRPVPSVDTQLRDLHSSLPILSLSLSVPPDSTSTWSAPRWEVLLEGFAALLLALLGGAVRGDVRDDVGKIVGEWVRDLEGLGIRVQVEV